MERKVKDAIDPVSSRVSGSAGVGFALVIVLGNAVLVPAGLPRPGTDPAEAVAFFGRADDVVGIVSGVAPVAWLLAVLFGAGALAALRAYGQPRDEVWALAGFAGLILQNTTFTGVIAIRLALTAAPGDGAAALWALHDALLSLNGAFLATAMIGFSVAGLRAGLIRPWHGVLGFCAAALQFAGAGLTWLIIADPGPLGLLGLAGWLLWVVWVGGYGIVLIRLSGEQGQLAARVMA
jgi:hypothetical protein